MYICTWIRGGLEGRVCLQCRRPKFDPWLGRSPEEGNHNPLQYSCLENPMDRGAWRATVHRVTKSQTELRDFTLHRWRLGIRHMTKSGKVRRQMLRKGWFGTLKTNCPFLVSLKYRRKFLNLYNYLKICQLMVYTVPKQKFETNKRYQSPKNFWHPQ